MNAFRLLRSPGSSRWSNHLPARLIVAGVLVALCGVVAMGCGDDETAGETVDDDQQQQQDESEQDDDPPPAAPDAIVDIGTAVDSDTVTAGQSFEVECLYFDIAGNEVTPSGGAADDEDILAFPDSALDEEDDGQYVAYETGPAEFACQSDELGLTDSDPAEVTVEPADVHTTTTELDDHQIVAGNEVEATCEAFDSYGNRVDDADFELRADTSAAGIVIDDTELTASITTTGIFTFDCHVEGVTERFGDTLEVLPDKPADLFADPTPDQTVYGVGQVINIGAVVQDRFGNPIPYAQVDYEADPDGETFGDHRFRFDDDGLYVVTVEVTEETHQDQELIEEVEIFVNDTGPDINCLAPADGQMVDHAPGTDIDFSGSVTDEFGVDEVTVNGQEVSLEDKNQFETELTTRYGINFVDIVATDDFGEENVRTCAFLVAEHWEDEEYSGGDLDPGDNEIDDAVSLQLRQDAIDDGDYDSDELRSLNDLIMTVLNSDGLETTIRNELVGSGPYHMDYCNFDVYINDVILHNGPLHTTSLDLVGGGLEFTGTINEVVIDLTLTDGSSAWNPICWASYHPDAHIDYISVGLTSDLGLSNNMPELSLASVDFVESGEVELEGGNAFSDLAYDVVASFFQDTIQGVVEDTFEDAIVDNFDTLFSDLIESLDVDSLATTFDVPRLDGSGNLPLHFGFSFSHVGATFSRALFGLAPAITPQDGAEHGINSLGIPHPGGSMLNTPFGHAATGSAHISLLNQALHSLWRGGLFHADIGGALGDDLPEDTSVELEAGLPPVAVLDDDGAELMLGAITIDLLHPGLFDEPVTLDVGATASTDVNLVGEEIDFDDVELDEFYLSARNVSINEGTRDVLEDFIGGLLQDILDDSVNAALPSLPIPSFTIPWSMWNYDLPAGEDIGLVNTSLDQDTTHLTIQGEFGIQ